MEVTAMVRAVIIKCGNIATSTMVDLLLDETAARDDLEITVIGSGPKMTPRDTERIARLVPSLEPQMVVVCGPNVGSPGMVSLRKALAGLAVPRIMISDGPSKKVKQELEKDGFGYLIMDADPLIGARREFLDPTEMAIFNADVTKVLAVVGSFRAVQDELDKTIEALKRGEAYLPRAEVSDSYSLPKAGFSNPYARSKAAVAFRLLEAAAQMNYRACFVEKEMKKYVRLAASAHEAVRTAAKMADEARELEKGTDTVLRTPHSKSGKILKKRALLARPKGGAQ